MRRKRRTLTASGRSLTPYCTLLQTTWLNHLKEAEDKYKEACQKKTEPGSSEWPFEEDGPKLTRKSKSLKVSRSNRPSSIRSTHSAAPGVTSSRTGAHAHSPSPSISSTGDSLFPFDSREAFQRDLSLSESGTFSCGPDLISEEENENVVEALLTEGTSCPGATGLSGEAVCIPKTNDTLSVPMKALSAKHQEVRQKSLPNTLGSSKEHYSSNSCSSSSSSPPSVRSVVDATKAMETTRGLISPPHSPRAMAVAARIRRLDTLKAIHEKSQSTDAIYI